jgi:spectrin beta
VKRKSEDDNENVEKRQKKINATYNQLLDLAQVSATIWLITLIVNALSGTCNVSHAYRYLQQRHALLEDAIRLYGFYRECDDFEKWIKDKERMLRADDSADNVEAAKRKYEVRSSDHVFIVYFSQGVLIIPL